jgi:hypothetical protein
MVLSTRPRKIGKKVFDWHSCLDRYVNLRSIRKIWLVLWSVGYSVAALLMKEDLESQYPC